MDIKRVVFTYIIIAFASGTIAYAQDDKVQDMTTSLTIGTVKTEAEKQAIKYGIKYLPVVNRTEIMKASKAGVFYIKPSVTLEAGEDDTFQNGSIAAQGFYMLPDDDPAVSGWIFPYSAGLEASRNLESYAGIAEVGITTPYRPISWLPGDIVLGREIKFGLFGQIGYKFQDQISNNSVGTGLENSSKEQKDDVLGRVKGITAFDLELPELTGFIKTKIKATATFWYDIANEEFYDREEASFCIAPLFWQSVLKNKHIDLSYEHGSGAPTFNKGDQYGVALTMEF